MDAAANTSVHKRVHQVCTIELTAGGNNIFMNTTGSHAHRKRSESIVTLKITYLLNTYWRVFVVISACVKVTVQDGMRTAMAWLTRWPDGWWDGESPRLCSGDLSPAKGLVFALPRGHCQKGWCAGGYELFTEAAWFSERWTDANSTPVRFPHGCATLSVPLGRRMFALSECHLTGMRDSEKRMWNFEAGLAVARCLLKWHISAVWDSSLRHGVKRNVPGPFFTSLVKNSKMPLFMYPSGLFWFSALVLACQCSIVREQTRKWRVRLGHKSISRHNGGLDVYPPNSCKAIKNERLIVKVENIWWYENQQGRSVLYGSQ